MGAELTVGHRGVVAAVARVAQGVLDDLAGEGAMDRAQPPAAWPAQDDETLLRAHQELGLGGAARDRLHHPELLLGTQGAPGLGARVAYEQADVLA